ELGPGTIVSTGAVVFAGTRIGARVIVGDQACIRERCEVGDDVVIGRGSLVENDTTIGALTKIQAHAYVTAYSTLEENVFVAPCGVDDPLDGARPRGARHAVRQDPGRREHRQRPGSPEVEVHVRLGRPLHPRGERRAGGELDRVDVERVVPVVERRPELPRAA